MINLTNTGIVKNFITILLLFLSSLAVAQLNVTADRIDSYYEIGETVNFNITSDISGTVNYTLKYDNYTTPIATGSLTINAGQTLIVQHQASESGIVLCSVEQSGNSAIASAAFSPFDIEAFVDEPSDFDAFWNTQKNILAGIPINAQVTFHSSTPYSTTYRVNIATIDNRRVYGYLSVPNGTGPFPAFIHCPPYGDIANMALPDEILAERGNVLVFSIGIHNEEPDEVDPNAYEPNDISNKEGMYYKTAIMAGVRAIDYIFSRSDFDGENIGMIGVSQGAGLSTIISGLDNRVKYLIMSNPILGQATGLQLNRAGGFPNFISQSRQEVGTAAHEALTAQAIKYYDTVFFARRFRGVSWSFISYEDEVTPAATSFAVFNALRGKKILTHSINLGHTQPFEFWNHRDNFIRRFMPETLNPPFPFTSTDQGYFIDAGQDISVDVNTSTNLSGTTEYNSNVNPNFELQWVKKEGPGNVSFGSPSSYNTTASFDTEGTYILQLAATDYSNDLYGEQKYYSLFDEIMVTVGEGNSSCLNPVNVALGKSTSQSTTQQNGTSDKAVDGITDGNFWGGSVAQTNWSNQPWWEIDLEEVVSIENINIWNRTDCCGEFFKDFYILISDNPFTSTDLNTTLNQSGVQSFYVQEIVGTPSNVSINSSGRYVRIQMNGAGFMTLAEVEIFSCETQSNLQPQSITFSPISNKLTTDLPFAINAVSTSGLPVTFNVVGGGASVNGNIVTLNGTSGAVVIEATQSGNSQFLPAAEVIQTFEVEEPNTGCPNPQNVALGKFTNQSSTQQNGTSDKAVDGNTDGNLWVGQSVAISSWSNQPWWEVDLGSSIDLTTINIWNRTDCCGEFFKEYYVLVSETPFSSTNLNQTLNQSDVSSFYFSEIAGSPTTSDLDIVGRYVRIQMTGTGFLNLAEVEIFGCGGNVIAQPQNIFFDFISDKLTTDPPFFPNANSTSGLPISFAINGPATLNGNQIVLTGQPGMVTVTASQGGNAQFVPATDIFRTFRVTAPETGCENPSNIAINKPTSQSGTQVGATSFRAVDGNTDGDFWVSISVINTNWQVEPWWEVDLGGVTNIESINVWNRTDCCAEALSNFYVLVSEAPFNSTDLDLTLAQAGVTAFFVETPAGTPTALSINIPGRYVRVQLEGAGFLTMAELEVIACPPVIGFQSFDNNTSQLRASLIYPNPADDFVKIDTKIFIGKKLEIQIFDNLGSMIIREEIDEVAGGFHQIPLDKLESGSYFVNLISDGFDKKLLPLIVIK